MKMVAAILFSLLDLTNAHGSMVWPPPRQGGATTFQYGADEKRCERSSCNWGTAPTEIDTSGKEGLDYTLLSSKDPHMADPTLLKMADVRYNSQGSPWRAPGNAPVDHPCGLFKGGRGGNDKSTLDSEVRHMVKWQRGTTQEVAWTCFHNHEGGYAYRLLKVPNNRPKEVKELDFQAGTLELEGDTSIVRTTDGENPATLKDIEIPANRGFVTQRGIKQQWTENPFRENAMTRPEAVTPPRPAGITKNNFYNRHEHKSQWNWKFSLVDKVKVPATLELGHYYVSWRWDASTSKQVFSNCGDIEITDGPSDDAGSTTVESESEPKEPEDETNGSGCEEKCIKSTRRRRMKDCRSDCEKSLATTAEPEAEPEDEVNDSDATAGSTTTEPEAEPEDESDTSNGNVCEEKCTKSTRRRRMKDCRSDCEKSLATTAEPEAEPENEVNDSNATAGSTSAEPEEETDTSAAACEEKCVKSTRRRRMKGCRSACQKSHGGGSGGPEGLLQAGSNSAMMGNKLMRARLHYKAEVGSDGEVALSMN